jgi:hypothetical protein
MCTVITEIELTIKSYAKGLISESEAVDLVRAAVNVYQRPAAGIPVIDTYGLGPKLDPEAYGLPAKNGW